MTTIRSKDEATLRKRARIHTRIALLAAPVTLIFCVLWIVNTRIGYESTQTVVLALLGLIAIVSNGVVAAWYRSELRRRERAA